MLERQKTLRIFKPRTNKDILDYYENAIKKNWIIYVIWILWLTDIYVISNLWAANMQLSNLKFNNYCQGSY